MPPPINSRSHRWTLTCPELGVLQVADVELLLAAPGDRHRHMGVVQVVVLLQGELDLEVRGEATVRIPAGSRYAVPPGCEHQAGASGSEPLTRFVDLRIGVNPATPLAAYAQAIAGRPPAVAPPDAVAQAVDTLAALAPFGLRPPMSRLAAAIWGLLALFDDAHPAQPPPPEPQDPRVRMAEVLLREHLSQPLSVEALARRVHLSPSHLRDLYVEAFGEPPARRLRRLRVDQARHYLAASVLSTTEIARACGFTSLSHFSRVFQDQVGCRPTAYRRRMRA